MSKKDQILYETYLLFSEYGYALSLSQVTSKLGLKKQSIYNYFVSKDDLISEMLMWKIDSHYEDLAHVLYSTKEDIASERLNALIIFTVDYFKSPVTSRLRRWISMSNTHNNIDAVLEKRAVYESLFFDELRLIIQEAMDTGEISLQDKEDVLMTFIILTRGMIDGLATFNKNNNYEELTNNMIAKFWKMMI